MKKIMNRILLEDLIGILWEGLPYILVALLFIWAANIPDDARDRSVCDGEYYHCSSESQDGREQ